MNKKTPLQVPGQVSARLSFSEKVPDGDSVSRAVCDDCGFIHYVNPKIVVGSVVTWQGQFLLCRRAIEPRKGFWTLPAGFMEEGETPEEGARREAWEEACTKISIRDLLAVYTVRHISQVQLMYRAELTSDDFGVGEESQEVRLFDWDEIPWDALAFPSVHWALEHFRQVEGEARIVPFVNPD